MNLETTIVVALIAAIPTLLATILSSRSQKKRDKIDALAEKEKAKAETNRVQTEKQKAAAEIETLIAKSEKDIWERTQIMHNSMATDLDNERKKRRDVESLVEKQAERIDALEASDRLKDAVIEKQAIRIAALEESDRLKDAVIKKQASRVAALEQENKTLRHENSKTKGGKGGSKRTL